MNQTKTQFLPGAILSCLLTSPTVDILSADIPIGAKFYAGNDGANVRETPGGRLHFAEFGDWRVRPGARDLSKFVNDRNLHWR